MKTVLYQSSLNNGRDRVDVEDEFARRGRVLYWTPVLTCVTPGDLSVSYTTQYGECSRSGNLVEATFRIITSAFTWSTASGLLEISGLPFTASMLSKDANAIWHGSVVWGGITKAGYTDIKSQIAENTNVLQFTASGSGVAPSGVVIADLPSGGSVVLRGSLVFRIR